MTDTVKTVKSSGGDYSSLSSWESGQQKSITAGNREIADCYAFQDTTAVTISGWTVPSGAEIIVRAATGEQHTGLRGTGYRLVVNTAFVTLTVSQNYVTFNGIAIRGTYSSAGSGSETVRCNSIQSLRFLNCLIESELPDAEALRIDVSDSSGRDAVVVNSIINATSSSTQALGIGGQVRVYNCAVVNGGNGYAAYGYNVGNNSLSLKNCYLHRGTGTNVWGLGYGSATFTTGRHSTSQSITGSTGSTSYNTSNFTNVTGGSEDFTLPSGSALIDVGTDLSGDSAYAFSTDIIGTTRSGTWEVGPFNYAAASTTRGTPFGARGTAFNGGRTWWGIIRRVFTDLRLSHA